MPIFLVALFSICLSVAAQFSLKTGMASVNAAAASGVAAWQTVLTNSFVLFGFALYGLGALVWLQVLARWDVSKAYPLVGLGFVLTAVIGWGMGENVTMLRLAGVALIGIGVVCISWR